MKSGLREIHDMPGDHTREPRPTAAWGARIAQDFARPPVWGQYPKGFVPWAARCMRVREDEILHVCAGNLSGRARGLTVDIRPSLRPDVVADGRALPFANDTFAAVMIDPPYSEHYARTLYNTDYPRPSHLLREAARVCRPGGAIGFLHWLVPFAPPGASPENVWGVVAGGGYQIRAFSVFRMSSPGLF